MTSPGHQLKAPPISVPEASQDASDTAQGTVVTSGHTEQQVARSSRQQQRNVGQTVAVSNTSTVSNSTCLSHMSCVDLPCRMDLSHVVATFASSSGAAPDDSSRSKGQRKRPRAPETTCYRYGNYHRYYGYRLTEEVAIDPRLEVLDVEWFSRKHVLDVGCNDGRLTLSMACKYGCRSAVGVDIDPHLISRACASLATMHTKCSRQIAQAQHKKLKPEVWSELRKSTKALKKTSFVYTDFVNSSTGLKRADTILCLSVTKWVQLNWGDEGLEKLFKRVYDLLRPGGIFVLEPQPWKSYRQAFKKQDIAPSLPFKDCSHISIRPAMFVDVLTKQFGFELVDRRQVNSAATGFDRPLIILRKPSQG